MEQSDSLPKKPSPSQDRIRVPEVRSKRRDIILFLLLTSPFLGEMLSGSTPPGEWLNPAGAFIMIVLYGTGTILIREARSRWNLGWSTVFLAIAYGIVEEGIMMQSFFNHNHADLGDLSRYGMSLGVQWPWAVMLIVYHGSISTLIPLSLADFLWPDRKKLNLLKKKGLLFTSTGFILVSMGVMVLIWQQQAGFPDPYRPEPMLLLGSAVVTGLFIASAYLLKNASVTPSAVPVMPPVLFSLFGCLFLLINLLFPPFMASSGFKSWITLLFQGAGIVAAVLFFRFQVFNENADPRHYIGFVFGAVLSLILLTPVHQFANHVNGMIYVGMISLVLLLIWRRIAIRKTVLPGV